MQVFMILNKITATLHDINNKKAKYYSMHTTIRLTCVWQQRLQCIKYKDIKIILFAILHKYITQKWTCH